MFVIRTEESSRSGRDASVTLESFALLCKIFKCFFFLFFACETTSFDGEVKRCSQSESKSGDFEAAVKHVSQRSSGWVGGWQRGGGERGGSESPN